MVANGAVTGAWRRTRAVQAGAGIWGTGWNPVHAQRMGYGRNVAPSPPTHLVDPVLTQQYESVPDGGYTSEDFHVIDAFGYGTQTGTADRPGVGDPDGRGRINNGYPPWSNTGDVIRAENHGANRTNQQLVIPQHDAAQGWLNKAHGEEGLATPSDPSQYEVATSMRQRMEVREGSQAQPGRASQFLAPIASRLVGQKLRVNGSPLRHNEMQRAAQSISIRGFWNRGAGTGPPEWMQVNEAYQSVPLQRTVPADPYQGAEVGTQQATILDEGWYY